MAAGSQAAWVQAAGVEGGLTVTTVVYRYGGGPEGSPFLVEYVRQTANFTNFSVTITLPHLLAML